MNITLIVRDIFSIAFGKRKEGQSIAMWKAYLDESGNDPNEKSGVFIMAGFLGTEKGWDTVQDQWAKALSPLNSLHTTEFMSGPGDCEFKRLKLQSLSEVMLGCSEVAPTVVLMSWNDYRDLVIGKIAEEYSDPYTICAQLVVASIMKALPLNEQVGFVFEYEQKHKNTIDALRDVIFDVTADPRLISITQIKKDQCILFQPADLLAYAALQRYREGNQYPTSFKAKATRPILGNGTAIGMDFYRRMIKVWIEQLTARIVANENKS